MGLELFWSDPPIAINKTHLEKPNKRDKLAMERSSSIKILVTLKTCAAIQIFFNFSKFNRPTFCLFLRLSDSSSLAFRFYQRVAVFSYLCKYRNQFFLIFIIFHPNLFRNLLRTKLIRGNKTQKLAEFEARIFPLRHINSLYLKVLKLDTDRKMKAYKVQEQIKSSPVFELRGPRYRYSY